MKYDAKDRLTNMVDSVGSSFYSYSAVGELLSDDGPWDNDTISLTHSNRLRASLSLQHPTQSPWQQTYGYDSMRRLTNVYSPAGRFGYAYRVVAYDGNALFNPETEGPDATGPMLLQGSRVERLSLPGGSVITNLYDIHARQLGTYLRDSSGNLLNKHEYAYNDGSLRTKQTRTSGDYVDYAYDSIGQLQSALAKESGGGTDRWQERFFYGYDKAGNLSNRVQNVQTNVFHVNNLNQLSSVVRTNTSGTVGGVTTIGATTVTVAANGGGASAASLYSDRTFARTNVTLLNGNNTFTAVASAGTRGDTNTITVNLPVAVTFLYDQNGNMRTNGTRVLEYDDENQLTRITDSGSWKSEFVYDGKLRMRISRDYTWRNGAWVLTNEIHRVYDGMLVIQERDQFNVPKLSYTRGIDLNGTLHGGGGIGGLLALTDHSVQSASYYFYADGNGHITSLIDTNENLVAQYLYDPFGNSLSSSGLKAGANKYRFGSKELQVASGLVYYGYRFYEPTLQRWVNRDPIGEAGSVNLYQNVYNSPLSFVDYLGREPVDLTEWPPYKDANQDKKDQLNRGCIGLCSWEQSVGCGKPVEYPENAKQTTCYASKEQADQHKCSNNKVPFVFAKQGNWKNDRPPKQRRNGRVPNDSISSLGGDYNYVTCKDGKYIWMDQGFTSKNGVLQIPNVYEADAPPSAKNEIWCVTCKCK